MATYYVGSGGNDGSAGTSWAARKLTLNGAEDIPVAANDTVYVGPGTYRELLTVDVSGTSSNPITYIGDYTGANTDGVGGVVRITGSDNDQTATRANCISASSRNYRTFTGFVMDTTTSQVITMTTAQNWIINKCIIHGPCATALVNIAGASQSNCTFQNCVFFGINGRALDFTHSSAVDNAGHVVENCIFYGLVSTAVRYDRIGGITVRNCFFTGTGNCVRVGTAPTASQTVTVNNCIMIGNVNVFFGSATSEIIENYNCLMGNSLDRTLTNTGANSNTYTPLLDTRWFFQLVNASNTAQFITPFDLASYSALVNVAGTSPTSTDMRGTAVQGAQREWGALEYDSGLKIKGQVLTPRGMNGGING
jgi:hypothetical protein